MGQKLEVYEDIKEACLPAFLFDYKKYCSMILVIRIKKGRKEDEGGIEKARLFRILIAQRMVLIEKGSLPQFWKGGRRKNMDIEASRYIDSVQENYDVLA